MGLRPGYRPNFNSSFNSYVGEQIMNEQTPELEVLANEEVLETLTNAGLEEAVGEVHVILGTGGQTAVRVSGGDVTIADVIQGAAQAIDPNARLVIRETLEGGDEQIRFAGSGEQQVYLLRNGNQVTGAGLGTRVQPGDSVVTGRKHNNG